MPHLVMGIVHLVTDREDKSGEPGNGLSVLMQGFIRNKQKAYRLLKEPGCPQSRINRALAGSGWDSYKVFQK